jgi:hypothetical protein
MVSSDLPAKTASHDEPLLLVCDGDYWLLSSAGETISLRDTKGLHYLRRLLQNPNQEFSSFDLELGAVAGLERPTFEITDSLTVSGPGHSGEMLDRTAISEYRRRQRELQEELEELKGRADIERATRIEYEIDFLSRELTRALGIGGRARSAGSAAERARLNVTPRNQDCDRQNF